MHTKSYYICICILYGLQTPPPSTPQCMLSHFFRAYPGSPGGCHSPCGRFFCSTYSVWRRNSRYRWGELKRATFAAVAPGEKVRRAIRGARVDEHIHTGYHADAGAWEAPRGRIRPVDTRSFLLATFSQHSSSGASGDHQAPKRRQTELFLPHPPLGT